ncbi:hypothetical protein [Sphingobium aquiterrae]|uniref:hypothetical protein n=1 Tax=Sphingobium aquiterrae TaxID=2038656 RepID=UPI003AFA103D
MRFLAGLLLVAVILIGTAYAFGLFRIEQTRNASLPSVAVKPGTLPAYRADVAKVDVGTRNQTVEVPTVNVTKPQ